MSAWKLKHRVSVQLMQCRVIASAGTDAGKGVSKSDTGQSSSCLLIRERDLDLTVQPPWPHQCWVQHIWSAEAEAPGQQFACQLSTMVGSAAKGPQKHSA